MKRLEHSEAQADKLLTDKRGKKRKANASTQSGDKAHWRFSSMSLPRQSDDDRLNQTSVSQFNSSKRLLLGNGHVEQGVAES